MSGNGVAAFTAPFLYRIHPDELNDFQRITKGWVQQRIQSLGLQLEAVVVVSGFGTALAALVNQYMVRASFESTKLVRPLVFFMTLILIPAINLIGWLIDAVRLDKRFTLRHLFILRRIPRGAYTANQSAEVSRP